MAAQGNNAAHIQSRGLGDGVSEDIKYWNQDAARRREEGRLKDNEDYNRAQKKREEDKAFYEKNIKPLNNWETGVKSLTELQARTLQQAADERFNVMEKLKTESPGSENYIKLSTKLSGLNSVVGKIKPFSDKIAELVQEVEANVKSGTIKDNDKVAKFRSTVQDSYDSYQTGFDDNGDLVIAYRDINGDGENDIIGTESFNNIMNGVTSWKFDPNFDIDGLAKGAAAELGKNEDVSESGYVTDTIIGPLEGTLSEKAKSIMVSPGGGLTSEGKSFAQDLGLDPDKEETITAVLDGFKQKMETYVDRTRKKEVDYSAINSAGRLNLDRQKEGNKQPKITEPVTPTNETWNLSANKIDPNKVNSLGVSGVSLDAIRDGSEVLSNAEVQNATYNKDGNMVLDVVVPKYKSMTSQDYSALEARASSGDADATRELRSAKRDGKGGARVVIPGQNERKAVVVPKEDEAKVASEMGETIESLKGKIYKDEVPQNSSTNKKQLTDFNYVATNTSK
ncbi:virion structural protein [Cellulophaga phage phi19:3]|uniref:Structural protein n=1 Tax=Cellulophaga phage phi19:3 TaxID=1327971 RepID=R9ZWQ8_9CAUD|nr:virion structural protein [Cellulophaga phage phi19:3]AGO47531.1 structural protein [Cellulophaga phage phi19:3]